MTEFQRQINNRERTKKSFPVGCTVYIDHIEEKDYHPDVIGHKAIVTHVDDASQVTCKSVDGNESFTVCREYGDVFFRVKEGESK